MSGAWQILASADLAGNLSRDSIAFRMPLEDHIGDICRKARLQTKTSEREAALVAGLPKGQLHEWETKGLIDIDVDVEGLAALVGLDVSKAKAIAGGWIPESFICHHGLKVHQRFQATLRNFSLIGSISCIPTRIF